MFRISRHRPWPPSIDLSTVRETLIYMRDDARSVPGLENVATALEAAIDEIDSAQEKLAPTGLTPITSRFLPARLRVSTQDQ